MSEQQAQELENLLAEMIADAREHKFSRSKIAEAYQLACHLAKQVEEAPAISAIDGTRWEKDDIHSWAYTVGEKVEEGHATVTADYASDGADLNSWTFHVTLTEVGREAIKQEREELEREEQAEVLAAVRRAVEEGEEGEQ